MRAAGGRGQKGHRVGEMQGAVGHHLESAEGEKRLSLGGAEGRPGGQEVTARNRSKTGRTARTSKEKGAVDGSRERSYFYLIGQANFKQFSGTICEK